MRQVTLLPAKVWLDNFFLLLKFTCQKQSGILSAHKQQKRPPEYLVGHKMGKAYMETRSQGRDLGQLENFILLPNVTCPKHRRILEMPTSNFQDLLRTLVGKNKQTTLGNPIIWQTTSLPARDWFEKLFISVA